MLIATDRFRSALESIREFLGINDLRWAEVPHPIGSLRTEELRERAKQAVDQFETIVTRGGQKD
jgi:hypothetical protein